jgi:hypothetical protein
MEEPSPNNDPPAHSPYESSKNGFIRLNTHDTSLMSEHIPRIETFAEDLQAAVNAAWPSRGRSRYSEVYVLLMSWEDDTLGVETEMRLLGKVFSNLYRYEVQEFKIPTKTPGKATMREVSRFLENDGLDNLLIVYYAGHARLSLQANEPPIWVAYVFSSKYGILADKMVGMVRSSPLPFRQVAYSSFSRKPNQISYCYMTLATPLIQPSTSLAKELRKLLLRADSRLMHRGLGRIPLPVP